MSPRRPLFKGAILCALVIALSCTAPLHPGAWGRIRFIGQVKGQPPLDLLPPISDRNGDIFTLYGAIGLPLVAAFVSRGPGGSFQSCAITKGDMFGAHGWVGFAQDRAWYWSGGALVAVPATSSCEQILNTDPSTNADILFKAVIPWVRNAPSRTTLVALIQSPIDPLPFSTLIDLDTGISTNIAELQPTDASSAAVLGVGADPDNSVGFVLVSYVENGGTHVAAEFYDESANLVAAATITGAPPPEYGILGYLQPSKSGRVLGLSSTGSIVTFDQTGGAFVAGPSGFMPVGIHRWDDQLWLVGFAGGKPAIVPLGDDGQASGTTVEWTASEQAAAALNGSITVTDDRTFPERSTTWTNVTTAIGTFPFVNAQSPWPQSPGTTLWAVAGPQISSPEMTVTDVGVAPVGISYP